MGIDWARLRQIIDAHDRFLITSHVRPDGDAIGSELGMAALLEQKGKQSIIVNPSKLPPRYRFLDPAGKLRHVADVSNAELDAVGVFVILDTSAWAQLDSMGDVVRATKAQKVVIDHHVGHDEMGAELFKDSTASACGLLVAEAVEPLGGAMTRAIAEPLFVAMATDTGWFRFSSTDGRTLRVAARLADAGISVDRLYRLLYEENSPARVKLIGRTLESLAVVCGGRVAYSSIRQSDLRGTGAIASDSEDLVNYALSITGVEVGLMFVEQETGAVKVSFRSRGGVDCTRIAAQFGGGGHVAAAGATIHAPLDLAHVRVLKAVEAALACPATLALLVPIS
jgi:phosphoesterase RecJ-like protein